MKLRKSIEKREMTIIAGIAGIAGIEVALIGTIAKMAV